MRLVVGDAYRIDDAHPRAGEPLLAGEIRDGSGRSVREGVRAAVQEAGIEKRWQVAHRYRSVGETVVADLHFDQRLEPVETAGPVAHHPDFDAAPRGLRLDAAGDRLGAERQRA